MSEKVLLVDDEVDFLETLCERMRLRDMDVTTSASPLDAIKKVQEKDYDAIIMDLKMPQMDGLQLLKVLKEKNPDLQIILLTGHATVEKGIEAMKLGATDFLEKPVDLNVLTEKIHKAQAKKMIIVKKHTEEHIKEILKVKGW
ncbi:MAG: response regulator [Pseudomonadota bacterium]